MLSPFGKIVRKYRIDKELTLKKMADKLNYTSAFLSAVETGRKPVPAELVDKIVEAYGFDVELKEKLHEAANASQNTTSMRNLDAHSREVMSGFAREVPQLSEENKTELLEKFEKLLEEYKKKNS